MLAVDLWTGTGRIGSDLTGDFEKDLELVKQACETCAPVLRTEYNPEVVRRAWEKVTRDFHGDPECDKFTIREVVEYYLTS